MKIVKTLQKYKCDFCKKRSIKSAMERHEKVCFRNPNRFCPECKNTGEVEVVLVEHYTSVEPCRFCSQFNPQTLQEIEAYEKGLKPEQQQTDSDEE